jgi:UDP-N-acetylmuramoyl-tripeptide--D-alanyl-D-alanine ligase
VALAGVRDGHEFVEAAMAKGAAGALVSQAVALPAVMVADTLMALEKLGSAPRPQPRPALRGDRLGRQDQRHPGDPRRPERAGRAHSSVKSYNNHIGVPLTLARMPGHRAGGVRDRHEPRRRDPPLVRMVAPDVAVITTVGPVHTENFPDGEPAWPDAKAEIFHGLEPGGLAVLNADNDWF